MRVIDSALSAFTSLGIDPDSLIRFIAELSTGNQDRVLRTGSASPWGLAATVTGSDLNVTVSAGLYIVSGIHVFTDVAQVIAFTGSTGKYDIIQGNSSGILTRKTTASASPGGTTADTDNIILWEVFDDNSTIVSGNLTDKRVFA